MLSRSDDCTESSYTNHPSTPPPPSHPPLGLLTPSSSKASLSPPHPRYKHNSSQHKRTPSKRAPPSRNLFFPVRASLELYTQSARSAYMSNVPSRPASPARRSRALSPTRPELGTRPPSRCESLLRDTLRRADEQDRTLGHRSESRSPTRWAGRKTRPRGNSFLGAGKGESSTDSDCDCEENVFFLPLNDRDAYHHRAQAMAMRGRGASSASPIEAGSHPYGSPSSPSPMPPSMMRTRTAPAVPRAKGRNTVDETLTRPPACPRTDRRSAPNTVTQSHPSIAASSDSSPKQRSNSLSPHESVLRAKLEFVLQKAGPPHVVDEKPSQRRNHQRALSHGVTVVTLPRHRDDPSPNTPSPQSLAPSSLSNSLTDLAKVHSMASQRRDSIAYRTSPSSPPEPLTPPATPPFNARTASEVCKRMDGYVSFANVEGLGEPPGIDIDGDDSEEGLRRWGRWLRMWPFAHGQHGLGPAEHEAGHLVVGRHRSNSAVSR